jgi:serine/threonine protein kinase
MTKEEIADIMNEVAILQALDHPNIVKYYETYDDVRFLYLVMQYCPNGELFDSFDRFEKKGEKYTEKTSAAIIHKLLGALTHCHSGHIVHRDIKPENILFDAYDNILLVDFGLAKQTQATMDVVAGTPYFMAPEVIDGHY